MEIVVQFAGVYRKLAGKDGARPEMLGVILLRGARRASCGLAPNRRERVAVKRIAVRVARDRRLRKPSGPGPDLQPPVAPAVVLTVRPR